METATERKDVQAAQRKDVVKPREAKVVPSVKLKPKTGERKECEFIHLNGEVE